MTNELEVEHTSKPEKAIRIHFTGLDTLQLHGKHVPTFMDEYAKCIENNGGYFYSFGESRIMINVKQVAILKKSI